MVFKRVFSLGLVVLLCSVGMFGQQRQQRFLADNGTAAIPSFVFGSNLNTGLYRVGANSLGFSLNGALALTLAATGFTSTVVHIGPVGGVGGATYSFTGDLTTGIYHPAASQVGVVLNGVQAATFVTTAGYGQIAVGSVDEAHPMIQASQTVAAHSQGIIITHANGVAAIFADLGAATNGSIIFCSDCTIASPCAGAGTGAIAKRLNGVWVCN